MTIAFLGNTTVNEPISDIADVFPGAGNYLIGIATVESSPGDAARLGPSIVEFDPGTGRVEVDAVTTGLNVEGDERRFTVRWYKYTATEAGGLKVTYNVSTSSVVYGTVAVFDVGDTDLDTFVESPLAVVDDNDSVTATIADGSLSSGTTYDIYTVGNAISVITRDPSWTGDATTTQSLAVGSTAMATASIGERESGSASVSLDVGAHNPSTEHALSAIAFVQPVEVVTPPGPKVVGSTSAFALHKRFVFQCLTSAPLSSGMFVRFDDSNGGRTNTGLLHGDLEWLTNTGIPIKTLGLWGGYINQGANYRYPGFSPVFSISSTDYANLFDGNGGMPASFGPYIENDSDLPGMRHLVPFGIRAADEGTLGIKDGMLRVETNNPYADITEALECRSYFVASPDAAGVSQFAREGVTAIVATVNDDTDMILPSGTAVVPKRLAVGEDATRTGEVQFFSYRTGGSQDGPFWCIGQTAIRSGVTGMGVTHGYYGGGRALVEMNEMYHTTLSDEYVDGLITAWSDMVDGGYVCFVITSSVNDQNDTTDEAFDPDNPGSRLTGVFSSSAEGYKANMQSLINRLRDRFNAVNPDATCLFLIQTTHRNVGATQTTQEGYEDVMREIALDSDDVLLRVVSEIVSDDDMTDLYNDGGTDKSHLDETDDSYTVYQTAMNNAYREAVLASGSTKVPTLGKPGFRSLARYRLFTVKGSRIKR